LLHQAIAAQTIFRPNIPYLARSLAAMMVNRYILKFAIGVAFAFAVGNALHSRSITYVLYGATLCIHPIAGDTIGYSLDKVKSAALGASVGMVLTIAFQGNAIANLAVGPAVLLVGGYWFGVPKRVLMFSTIVIIVALSRVESSNIQRYQDLLTSGRVNRIYLDELENINQNSLGIATIQLIIAKENRAIETARELIERVRTQLPQPQNLLQLIEMILVYKLPRLSRREIEAMFSLDELKQTRYFQDVREEGKLEGELTAKIASVPRLLALGLTVEQIAEALQLTIEQVRKIQKNN
jgi:hypothetical protein